MGTSGRQSVRRYDKQLSSAAGALCEEPCNPVDASGGSRGIDNWDDEDLDGEEDSGEVQAARKVSQPKMPSKREREEHERTHCPYRCWCEHCVRGQGSEYKHSTVIGINAEEEVPRVILDYCFLTEDASRQTTDHGESLEATTSLTVLVMKETLCGSVWAYALKTKSVGDDPWVADQIVDDMCTVGMARERVIVKSDQEASIVELQLAIAKRRNYEDYGVGTGVENSKVGDSNSNGKIERAIRDVGNMVRTLRSALEEKIGGGYPWELLLCHGLFDMRLILSPDAGSDRTERRRYN